VEIGDVDFFVTTSLEDLPQDNNSRSSRAVNGIAFVGILLTYFPKRIRPMGTSKMDVVKKIDYIGSRIVHHRFDIIVPLPTYLSTFVLC
jgi:hypothetical protein